MKLRAIDGIWLLLLAATAFTWWLGHTGALAAPRLSIVAVVFGLAWLKGVGVILEFMELRHAPPLWRRALIGGLAFITALILLAYWVALA
ncbi:MAG: cytochrome C oxidase subunit IV family protein [Pseudomonadota bacterium]|nr:cytochrome C oxidase subunit IV family protein [Pseudomonadota bacterium]